MAIIGGHISTAGGLHKCHANAAAINADLIQIFGASPRQWKAALPTPETLEKFFQERDKYGKKPLFLHASYLPNLGTPNDEMYEKSIENLAIHLQIAELLEAEGLIYHIGSYKDSTTAAAFQKVADGMLKVLEKSPGKAHLIMENSAGGGAKIGITLEEIGEIYHLAGQNPRIKVCIDTAHAFECGLIENFSPAELTHLTSECDRLFGLQNLTVLHVNDSKTPFNSRSDRHENIGDGKIGLTAFQNLAKADYLKDLPWILEVPGHDNQGPDLPNVELTKSLFHGKN